MIHVGNAQVKNAVCAISIRNHEVLGIFAECYGFLSLFDIVISILV